MAEEPPKKKKKYIKPKIEERKGITDTMKSDSIGSVF